MFKLFRQERKKLSGFVKLKIWVFVLCNNVTKRKIIKTKVSDTTLKQQIVTSRVLKVNDKFCFLQNYSENSRWNIKSLQ